MSYISLKENLFPQAELEQENFNQRKIPTIDELKCKKYSSYWVIFLCFLQMGIALFAFWFGSYITIILTTIFTTFGFQGVTKGNVRYLIIHFIFSITLYILSVIGDLALILYCKCPWWVFVIAIILIMLQGIGLKHSRLLISYYKNYSSFNNNHVTSIYTTETQLPSISAKQVSTQTPSSISTISSSSQTDSSFYYPQCINIYPSQLQSNIQQSEQNHSNIQQIPNSYFVYPMIPTIIPPQYFPQSQGYALSSKQNFSINISNMHDKNNEKK
jgi:hypothetical protein